MEPTPLSRVISFGAVALLLPLSTAQAEVYRYVKDGQVFYGDRMPEPTHQNGHSVLNKQGVVFREVLSRDERRQKLRALEEREQLDSRDRALLDTFRTEDELVLAHDRRLALLDTQMEHIASQAESFRVRAVDIKQRIKVQEGDASYENNSSGLYRDLSQAHTRLSSSLAILNAKVIERNKMAARFLAERERYRELKARR
ncbi:MAG: DUF4124 domain-containing protein [Granulosicoccus sp.]